MNSKGMLLLPICFIGLVSCGYNTYPKDLSFDESLTYIKSKSKGVATPKEGYVEFSYENYEDAKDKLSYYGADGELAKPSGKGKNLIKFDLINDYIKDSDNPTSENDNLPLMYLNENNFKSFIGDDAKKFTYRITNIKNSF